MLFYDVKIKKAVNENFVVYKDSINKAYNTFFCMIKDGARYLLVNGQLAEAFEGRNVKVGKFTFKKCPLTHENAVALRGALPFTAPTRVLGKTRSFGLGDRLGIATVGHIRLFKNYDAYPVFAQQSIRELNLTERTYEDVLDCVTFNVFQEGYKTGWGADGDHLKKEEEIEYALKLGFSMITLDCSEHIRNDVNEKSDEEVMIEASELLTEDLKNRYIGKEFDIEGNKIEYTITELARCVLIYSKAIEFADMIYHKYITNRNVDFELSIDETATPTTPFEHFFVANELTLKAVKLQTVAPRFCGEFQKGIDYIGDLVQFEEEMKIHAGIARHFGYKLSIHSGSDKFSTFPIIGKYTNGNFHVKTAGTNWLEAMKVVAAKDCGLYREIHKYALSMFEAATNYYHVTTNIDNIPDIDTLKDEELIDLFNNNDCRQLIHITYGFILTSKDEKGKFVFKNRLYKLWDDESEEYAKMLENHIGHHLELLYKGFSK